MTGDLTFVFDGDATETKQLLGKLASIGALTEDTIEKLKDRGILWKKVTCSPHYYALYYLQDVQQQKITKVVQHTHNVMSYIQTTITATYSAVL